MADKDAAAQQQQQQQGEDEQAWHWSPPAGSDASLHLTDALRHQAIKLGRTGATITLLVQPITATTAPPSPELLRTLVSADITRRVLQHSFGFNVEYVLCIDDFAAPADAGMEFEKKLVEALKKANTMPPSLMLRASDYDDEIKSSLASLMQDGLAYEADGEIFLTDVNVKDVPPVTNLKLWAQSREAHLFSEAEWGRGHPTPAGTVCGLFHGVLDTPAALVIGGPGTAGVGIAPAIADAVRTASKATTTTTSSSSLSLVPPVCLDVGETQVDETAVGSEDEPANTAGRVLESVPQSQLRLAILKAKAAGGKLVLDDNTLTAARDTEDDLKAFLAAMKQETKAYTQDGFEVLKPVDQHLIVDFFSMRQNVHKALCNSMDTAAVLKEVFDLINRTRGYIEAAREADREVHMGALRQIGAYVTQLLSSLGVVGDMHADAIGFSAESTGASEEDVAEQQKQFAAVFKSFFQELSTQADPEAYKVVLDQAREEGHM